MATKEFGKTEATESRNYVAEVEKIAPGLPATYRTNEAGELIGFSYDTAWVAGGTEVVLDENDEPVDHAEKYKDKKLTAEQIKKLDAWAKANVKVA